jgi:hypothetical protein
MNFKNFIKIGVVTVVACASMTNALAAPVNTLIQSPQLDNTQIVQMIKANVSKDDLTFIVKNAQGKSERHENIHNKINNLINSKYSSNELDTVKNELNETLSLMGGNKVSVTYSYATPKQIIDEVAKEIPSIKRNHSSIANGAIDINSNCDVTMNLAIDNKGRLFESSELAATSVEQISSMSKSEIMNTLKETLLHEASHCLLSTKMKDKNFELKFSDAYAAKNPTIVQQLNEKISEVKEQIAGKKENIDILNLTTFINFHENFADVNAAFARIGINPTAETIKEAKEQLLNVAKFREKTDFQHQTQYAVQYALDKIDLAATMTPEQRVDFAQEIASDSLLNNMRLVLKSEIGSANPGTMAAYLVNGIKIGKDGSISEGPPEDKYTEYEAIDLEIEAMSKAKPAMGSITQELKSYQDLVAQYGNDKIEPKISIAFNANVFKSMREKATGNTIEQKSEIGIKIKPKG